jgi:hypothetical protein
VRATKPVALVSINGSCLHSDESSRKELQGAMSDNSRAPSKDREQFRKTRGQRQEKILKKAQVREEREEQKRTSQERRQVTARLE